ncbi:hypothetical protein HMPREF3033_00669 [Veillonellaceae bacterium DNF00751]|nr:hypothetical protein HMPREF3033_00669 [Veillonellaceae bacterium DNF00751]
MYYDNHRNKKTTKIPYFIGISTFTQEAKKMTHVGINTKLVISLGILLSYAFILNHI